MVHRVKGFGIVNKAEIDVFLELSCFFHDPMDVGNVISGSSAVKERQTGRCGIKPSPWGEGAERSEADEGISRQAVGQIYESVIDTTPHPSSGSRETPDATFPQGGRL